MIDDILSNPYNIAGALILPCFVAYLVWRNNYKTRHATASAAFRAAFADAFLRLTASGEATSIIIFQNHNGHLAAIIAFRPYVAWYRRRSFESAANEYSLQANIQQAKGPLEALAFDFTSEAQSQRAALLASIKKLLNHASAT